MTVLVGTKFNSYSSAMCVRKAAETRTSYSILLGIEQRLTQSNDLNDLIRSTPHIIDRWLTK